MRIFRNFCTCESGASAVEYALMLAIIGTALAISALFLGGAIGSQMNDSASCIQDSATC
jgi:pilus assembly protein Flp/PilA